MSKTKEILNKIPSITYLYVIGGGVLGYLLYNTLKKGIDTIASATNVLPEKLSEKELTELKDSQKNNPEYANALSAYNSLGGVGYNYKSLIESIFRVNNYDNFVVAYKIISKNDKFSSGDFITDLANQYFIDVSLVKSLIASLVKNTYQVVNNPVKAYTDKNLSNEINVVVKHPLLKTGNVVFKKAINFNSFLLFLNEAYVGVSYVITNENGTKKTVERFIKITDLK